MKQHIEKGGGKVVMNAPVKEIVTNEDGTVNHLLMRSGEKIEADEYISAMPVDIVKRMIPKKWQQMPYFRQFDELEGIPVINLHMWFDRKLTAVDHLCFSRSPLLSVYADMSVCCDEYEDPDKSMLELVFAPCSPAAGSDKNWIAAPDEEIIEATLNELKRLFPTEIGPGAPDGGAKVESRQLCVFRGVFTPLFPEGISTAHHKQVPSQTLSWLVILPARNTWALWRAQSSAESSPLRLSAIKLQIEKPRESSPFTRA